MAVFTKEGVRKALSGAWSTITGIPGTVLDIAALGDPGARRFVVWNDATNHLEYLDVNAAEIPFDNTVLGVLASTNVQDAIDELTGFITAGAEFAGYVASGAGSSSLPAGWSVSHISTGIVEITHNLGLATAHSLSVAASFNQTPADDRTIMVNYNSVNTFQIITVDVGSGVVDRDVFFIAKLNV